MLSLPCVVRIYLHVQPVNLHLGFDRLANLVREDMGQDPLGGHLFVFRNRRGDRVKLLFRDDDGYSCILEANLTPRGGSGGQLTRPHRVPRYRAGATVSRSVELYHGGLSGRVLELKWQARWDSPDGELICEGQIESIEIEPGVHATRTVEFPLPKTVQRERALYLVLESLRPRTATPTL